MKGIPAHIQTRADLNNLFALAQQGEIDKGELAARINSLLALQYRTVPILSADGAVVTTRYFYEVAEGDVTDNGLSVASVEHIEQPAEENPDAESTGYSKTMITLSAPMPPGTTVLSIYKPVNFLTEGGFDLAEINYILGVLAQ